jgi:hypothetical protein
VSVLWIKAQYVFFYAHFWKTNFYMLNNWYRILYKNK